MSLVSVECPSCGATLPPREPSGRFVCDYCQAQFEPAQVKHAQDGQGHAISTAQLAEAIVQAQRKMAGGAVPSAYVAPPVTPSKGGGCGLSVAIFGLVTAMGIGIGAYSWMKASGGGGGGGGLMGPPTAGGALSAHMIWDTVGGPPMPVTVQGKPAVIGRTREVQNGDKVFIDAYDMSADRLWRIEGLGTYGDAHTMIRYGVAGEHVVVSSADAKLRVVALDDASVEHEISLSDRVDRICSKRDAVDGTDVPDEDVVWIEQIDEKSYLVDASTGELTEAGEPPWCQAAHWPSGRAHEERHPAELAPEVEGAKVLRAYVDGDVGVAAAVKSPGTEVPRAIGFDPETREVRWDEVVSKVPPASNRDRSTEFSALAGGKYFAIYGEGQDAWHLAALDAATGASMWDVTLRDIFAVDTIKDMEATGDHVFVVRTSSMEAFDADTGDLLMTVGRQTYE